MKINHLNLSVPDVAKTARFFEEFFGLRCAERKSRDVLVVLVDESGFSLILGSFDQKTKPEYPNSFHLGFIQARKEQVETVYHRLQAAGYSAKPPQSIHGSWGFYIHAPGDILIEVSCPNDECDVA